MLETESAIAPETISARGWFSVTEKKTHGELGFGRTLQYIPTLVAPIHGVVADEPPWYIHRPDHTPVKGGRPRKYLIPFEMKMALDINPLVRENLTSAEWPLFITEGSRKVDALISAGAKAVVGLIGVWNWRGSNDHGGKALLPDWEWVHLDDRTVIVVYDSDVAINPAVQHAMDRLGAMLNRRGANVSFAYLPAGPGGTKTGVDDFIARDGKTLADVVALAGPLRPPIDRVTTKPKPTVPLSPVPVHEAVATFRRWLHLPNPRPLYVAWGAAAANRLPGDPVWLLLVGASGAGKTEIVRSFNGLQEIVEVSTITETGLLSGTSRRERAEDATGGLLRQVGAMGTAAGRDFTSVLSMDRDMLSRILAALREIYDGKWQRHLGADGGRVLEWEGKLGLMGGVTGAIDRQFSVMSQMGERLLLYRMRSGELDPIVKRALGTVGQEEQMRSELMAATGGVFAASKDYTARKLTDEEQATLIEVGILVARGRAGVYRHGSYIDAIVDPEVPTRLARQLLTLARGMDSIGVPWSEAWPATLAVALGCIPDIRARALLALYRGEVPLSTTALAEKLHRPTNTVRYALEDLDAHRLAIVTRQGQGKANLWQLDQLAVSTLDGLPPGVIAPMTSTSPVDGGWGFLAHPRPRRPCKKSPPPRLKAPITDDTAGDVQLFDSVPAIYSPSEDE